MANRGKWVAFEGPDGSGKTKLAGMLHERYPESLLLPSPSCSIGGEFARSTLQLKDSQMALESRQLLFLADIVDTYLRAIVPALVAEKMVISDRWVMSTVIYQMALFELLGDEAVGDSVSSALMSYYHSIAFGMGPDITIMVNTPMRERERRLKERWEDQDQYEYNKAFQQIVGKRYDEVKGAKWYWNGLALVLTVPGTGNIGATIKMLADDIDRTEAPTMAVGPLVVNRLGRLGLS